MPDPHATPDRAAIARIVRDHYWREYRSAVVRKDGMVSQPARYEADPEGVADAILALFSEARDG